jgi:hypothetical protein
MWIIEDTENTKDIQKTRHNYQKFSQQLFNKSYVLNNGQYILFLSFLSLILILTLFLIFYFVNYETNKLFRKSTNEIHEYSKSTSAVCKYILLKNNKFHIKVNLYALYMSFVITHKNTKSKMNIDFFIERNFILNNIQSNLSLWKNLMNNFADNICALEEFLLNNYYKMKNIEIIEMQNSKDDTNEINKKFIQFKVQKKENKKNFKLNIALDDMFIENNENILHEAQKNFLFKEF